MIVYPLLALFMATILLCWLGALTGYLRTKQQFPAKARYNARMLVWLGGIGILTVAVSWLSVDPPAVFIYRYEFAEFPTADVQHLFGVFNGGIDGKEALLRFQAAPSTIQRLVNKQRLRSVSRAEFVYDGATNTPAPIWWHPKNTSKSQLYLLGEADNAFSHDKADLLYDPQTQIAYYAWFSEN